VIFLQNPGGSTPYVGVDADLATTDVVVFLSHLGTTLSVSALARNH
jgi:hypothetical protein